VRFFVSGTSALVSPLVSPVTSPRAAGIIGCICVGATGPRSGGCIPIGPVLSEVRFWFGIGVNARRPFLFWGGFITTN
jgi:hypothetical protein